MIQDSRWIISSLLMEKSFMLPWPFVFYISHCSGAQLAPFWAHQRSHNRQTHRWEVSCVLQIESGFSIGVPQIVTIEVDLSKFI